MIGPPSRLFRAAPTAFLVAAALLTAARASDEPDSALARAAALVADLRERYDRAFSALRSEHFIVVFDADELLARKLASRLETTYADAIRFCARTELPFVRHAEPLEVVFLDQADSYHAYAQTIDFQSTGTLGFFHAASNRSVFFNAEHDARIARLREQISQARAAGERMEAGRLEALLDQYERQINQMVVQHEGAHQILYNLGVHSARGDNPMWLVEGLAMLFETVPSGAGSSFEQVNQFRLFDLREAIRAGHGADRLAYADYRRAVDDGRLVDLRMLITREELWQAPGQQANNHYAMAWALAHFLLQTEPRALGAYLKTIVERTADEPPAGELAAFEAAFGELDEKFERRCIEFVLRLPVPRTVGKVW
jgi:hypothetical protein